MLCVSIDDIIICCKLADVAKQADRLSLISIRNCLFMRKLGTNNGYILHKASINRYRSPENKLNDLTASGKEIFSQKKLNASLV